MNKNTSHTKPEVHTFHSKSKGILLPSISWPSISSLPGLPSLPPGISKYRYYGVIIGAVAVVSCLVTVYVPRMAFPFTSAKSDALHALIQLYVSPLDIVADIKQSDRAYILVDIRSPAAYKKGHIRDAVNIPIVLKEGEIDDTSNFKKAFRALDRKKTIVIYGENKYSFITEKSVDALSRSGVQAKILAVGWNEFRHFVNFWLPEDQWETFNINLYVSEE